MKKIFLTCLVALAVVLALPAAAQISATSPAYFIDSQRVNFNSIYLDPNSIAQITVVKGADYIFHTDGKLYIRLKQPFTSFLTLSDIVQRQTEVSGKKMLFIINDQVIRDTAGIRIDPGLVAEVHGIRMADIHYVDTDSTMGVIVIRTKNHEEAQKDKEIIRIRG